jgi:hypothetical protein
MIVTACHHSRRSNPWPPACAPGSGVAVGSAGALVAVGSAGAGVLVGSPGAVVAAGSGVAVGSAAGGWVGAAAGVAVGSSPPQAASRPAITGALSPSAAPRLSTSRRLRRPARTSACNRSRPFRGSCAIGVPFPHTARRCGSPTAPPHRRSTRSQRWLRRHANYQLEQRHAPQPDRRLAMIRSASPVFGEAAPVSTDLRQENTGKCRQQLPLRLFLRSLRLPTRDATTNHGRGRAYCRGEPRWLSISGYLFTQFATHALLAGIRSRAVERSHRRPWSDQPPSVRRSVFDASMSTVIVV